jgi:threonine synthase
MCVVAWSHFGTRPLILAAAAFQNRCFALTFSRSIMTTDLPFSLTSAKRSSIHESIVDTIGNTPIVKLQRMSPKKGVDIYVKCESENPGGSVKDRLALGIIEWAEKHGQIKPGQVRKGCD